MNYKEFNEKIDCTQSETVLDGIQQYLDMKDLDPDQKMYGIKTLLTENTLEYISSLKGKIWYLQKSDFNSEIQRLRRKNNNLKEDVRKRNECIFKLKKQIAELEEKNKPKKRIVVVAKKKEDKNGIQK